MLRLSNIKKLKINFINLDFDSFIPSFTSRVFLQQC